MQDDLVKTITQLQDLEEQIKILWYVHPDNPMGRDISNHYNLLINKYQKLMSESGIELKHS